MKIKVYVNTGYAGCSHEDIYDIPDEEWNSLTEKEKQTTLDELATEFMGNTIDFGAYVLEEEDCE